MWPIRPVRMTPRTATPVTVTATLSDGLKWGTIAAAVDEVDTTTATFTVTLTAASCDEVTPVAPTVTQAVCRNGVFVPADGDVGDDRRDHLHGDPDGCRMCRCRRW